MKILIGITEKRTFYLPINLSFFEEGSAGEKTEKPTSRRRNKAREEGSVARSKEISTAVLFIFGFLALKYFGGYMYKKMADFFSQTLMLIGDINEIFNEGFFVSYLREILIMFITTLLPLYATIICVAFIVNVIQVGWKPTTKPLKLKFNFLKFNFKKIFSTKNLIELFKSLLKMLLISWVIYSIIKDEIINIQLLINMDIKSAMIYICNLSVDLGIRVGIWFIIVAVADYAYVRYTHEKKLKMSKQEIKDEYKMTEGDPHIKAKIKGKMREISMRRMMQNIPSADVIITNPTHYAVAIKYDRESSSAPIVVAKGVDFLAKRIREAAKENNIEIIENVQLARTLYATVDVGREIPPELYQAVAEILAFVYKLKNAI